VVANLKLHFHTSALWFLYERHFWDNGYSCCQNSCNLKLTMIAATNRMYKCFLLFHASALKWFTSFCRDSVRRFNLPYLIQGSFLDSSLQPEIRDSPQDCLSDTPKGLIILLKLILSKSVVLLQSLSGLFGTDLYLRGIRDWGLGLDLELWDWWLGLDSYLGDWGLDLQLWDWVLVCLASSVAWLRC